MPDTNAKTALSPNLQGMLWLLAAGLCLTGMTTIAKHLGQELPSIQVIFFRALMGFTLAMPFLLRNGLHGLKTSRPALMTVRAFVGSMTMMCGLYAVIYIPLADAITITYSRNLFVAILAVVILREVMGPRRIAVLLVGFFGVLLMMRPTGHMEPAALVAVAGAFSGGLTIILIKILSRTDSTAIQVVYAGLAGLVVTGVPTYMQWVTPTWEQLGLLLAMGVVSVTGQTCFIRGYAVGEASAIAPIDYTRLIFAGIAGFLFFGDVPDEITLIGAVIIVSTSFYMTYRETKEASQQAKG